MDLSERTAVYRLFSAQGELLYIGMTWQHLPSRMNGHTNAQPWWQEVDHATAIWYETWEEADRAETEAIRAERPKYNIAKVKSAKPARRRRRSTGTQGPGIKEDADGLWVRVPPGVGVEFVYPMPPGTLSADFGFTPAKSVTILPYQRSSPQDRSA